MTQLSGLLALSLGSAIFAVSRQEPLFILAALLLGIGTATMMTVDAAFVVGAKQNQVLEALRLTALNQTAIVGQLVGGLAIASLTWAGWSFQARFWVMAGIPLVGLAIAAATNREAAARIQVFRPETSERQASDPKNLPAMLVSTFGLFLFATVFNTIGHQAIWGQYPNYMQSVFQIDPALSATALSVAAVLTLIALSLGGEWMARSGPAQLYLMALGLRLAAAGGLVVLAMFERVPTVFPLAMYVVFLICIATIDLANPELAAQTSQTTTGATQGLVLGAIAVGVICGNLLGGWTAETFGFKFLPWLAVSAIGVSVGLGSLAIQRHRSHLRQL